MPANQRVTNRVHEGLSIRGPFLFIEVLFSFTRQQDLVSRFWMHAFRHTTLSGLRTTTTALTRTLPGSCIHTHPLAKMASTTAATDLPYKMHVTPDNTGLWHIKQTEDAAKTASQLLQEDMEVG